jgi:tetratricopeptide (TPR) repeat protein
MNVEAHVAVADAMLSAGLVDEAAGPLERAIKELQGSSELPQYDQMTMLVVETLLRLGKVDRAMKAAGGSAALVGLLLRSPGRLAQAVDLLCGAGQRTAAESLVAEARQAAPTDLRSRGGLASALAALGHTDEAAEAVAEARAAAAGHADRESVVDLLIRLADLLAAWGNRQDAQATLQEAVPALRDISDIDRRDRMRSELAQRIAKYDGGDAARELLRKADRPVVRAHALMQVTVTLVERGLGIDAVAAAGEAREVAEITSDPEQAAKCWTNAGFALMVSGQFRDAAAALVNAWLSASSVSRSVLIDIFDRTAVIANRIEPGDTLWALHRSALQIDAWWSPQAAQSDHAGQDTGTNSPLE